MTQRYFEDVVIDEELEPLERIPTVELAGGFSPGRESIMGNRFTDAAVNREIGIRGALVPGPLKIAWLTKYVSDWAGVGAEIASIRVALRRPDVAGKPLILSGRVVDKRISDGVPLVELEVVTLADGQPSVRANVQVRMPARA
jgi:hypothetical protein